jgi:drug/metabolite transporter (DMT)-like permease
MFYVLLRVLFMTAFAQLLRYSQARGGRVMHVVFVNYAFAALFCAALAASTGQLGWSGVTLWCGGIGGTAYLLSLVLLLPAMNESGLAISVAVLQLAVLVPVAASIVAFGERPSLAQIAGLVLAVAALVVLSFTTSAPGRAQARTKGGTPRFSPLLVPLFFVTGLSGVAMKAFHELGPPRERMSFNAVLFATATLSTMVEMRREARSGREQPRATGLSVLASTGIGLVIGAVNAGQLVFLMMALSTAPAMVVFPVSSALSLVANGTASVMLWREYLRPAGWLGLALALAASVLLNLHPVHRTSPPRPLPEAGRGSPYSPSPLR